MYGEFEHTIDSKGRMNFPAKLRESLGERFFISKTIGEKCLTVHTEQSWNSIRESLKGKPSKVALPIERFLFGGACEAEPDKQGRIALPASLRAYADITAEVVVVGWMTAQRSGTRHSGRNTITEFPPRILLRSLRRSDCNGIFTCISAA